jgi:hypothetical protein
VTVYGNGEKIAGSWKQNRYSVPSATIASITVHKTKDRFGLKFIRSLFSAFSKFSLPDFFPRLNHEGTSAGIRRYGPIGGCRSSRWSASSLSQKGFPWLPLRGQCKGCGCAPSTTRPSASRTFIQYFLRRRFLTFSDRTTPCTCFLTTVFDKFFEVLKIVFDASGN